MCGISYMFGKRFLRDALTEFRIVSNHLRASFNPSQRRLLKRLASQRNLRLHLGCGSSKLVGWINIDAFPGGDLVYDLRCGIPFPDSSARFIFQAHFLEHFDYYFEVPKLLAECCRVLEHGGVMRVVVPDAEKFVFAYQERTMDWFKRVEPACDFRTPCEGLAFNFQYQGQHHSAWDYETLAMNLKAAGFRQIERTEYGNGPIAELNLETDSKVRAIHSLCVNAVK